MFLIYAWCTFSCFTTPAFLRTQREDFFLLCTKKIKRHQRGVALFLSRVRFIFAVFIPLICSFPQSVYLRGRDALSKLPQEDSKGSVIT